MTTPPVMIVENDPADVLIFKRVLKDLGFAMPVEFATDGIQALEYLTNARNAPPWLIFLDLNIPRLSGLDFLARIKSDQRLKWIPVVVVSSSEDPEDISACASRGSCGYLIKDFEYEPFRDAVCAALNYWARCRTPIRPHMIRYCRSERDNHGK